MGIPKPPSGLGLPGMRLPPGMRMGPLGPVPIGAPYMHAAETSGELHKLQSILKPPATGVWGRKP
jgi:hypothetical protein